MFNPNEFPTKEELLKRAEEMFKRHEEEKLKNNIIKEFCKNKGYEEIEEDFTVETIKKLIEKVFPKKQEKTPYFTGYRYPDYFRKKEDNDCEWCPNHPTNGGSGVCLCVLGGSKVN